VGGSEGQLIGITKAHGMLNASVVRLFDVAVLVGVL
jgi:hypothetical protein